MNKGKLLRGLGAALAIFGLLVAAYSILPDDSTYDITIPSGDYFYYIKIGNVLSGSIDVEFTVPDGSVVGFVFTSDEFDTYASTGSADYLVRVSGNSGSYTFDLPDLASYYVVFQHSDVSWLVEQDVSIDIHTSGVFVTNLSIGVVLIVAGALMAFFGQRMMAAEKAINPPAAQAPTDVVVFQGGRQDPPGRT